MKISLESLIKAANYRAEGGVTNDPEILEGIRKIENLETIGALKRVSDEIEKAKARNAEWLKTNTPITPDSPCPGDPGL